MEPTTFWATFAATAIANILTILFVYALIVGDRIEREGKPMPWRVIIAGLVGPTVFVIAMYATVIQ
jgi:uncharacterized membrane protein YhaH (DUF805 family)